MLSRMKTGSSESLKGEVYFRIVPQTIKSISSANAADNLTSQWLLYLEKGIPFIIGYRYANIRQNGHI